jgi:hypothetical protein
MTLAPKALELHLDMECETFPEELLPVLKKFALSLSTQLSRVSFSGKLVDTHHVVTIAEAILSNANLDEIAFCFCDETLRPIKLLK